MSSEDFATHLSVLSGSRRDFDMDDGPEMAMLADHPTLRDALDTLKEEIAPAFAECDRAAGSMQGHHTRMVKVAAFFGPMAVVAAIWQLTAKAAGDNESWFHDAAEWVEYVGVGLGLAAIMIGVVLRLQHGWLVNRHKAESLRVLKFRMLADARLWCGDRHLWHDALKDEVAKIQRVTHRSLRARAKHDDIVPPRPELAACQVPRDALDALSGYFLAKRVDWQLGYFQSKSEEMESAGRILRRGPQFCFWAGIGCVVAHYTIKHRMHLENDGDLKPWALAFLALAAALPVIGTGFRAVRLAREHSRSALLFAAKAAALTRLRARLVNLKCAPGTETERILEMLNRVEDFLEAEQREWLRLMLETEWFG